jgi:hypothetical protein
MAEPKDRPSLESYRPQSGSRSGVVAQGLGGAVFDLLFLVALFSVAFLRLPPACTLPTKNLVDDPVCDPEVVNLGICMNDFGSSLRIELRVQK